MANGGMDPFRILEANDEGAAMEKGQLIADFQHELLLSSPEATAAQQDGMGHSWGLARITSSEVAGARYAQVHSLSGAGMPSGWTSSPDTEYFHWAYTDALSIAQETGTVWDGRIPTRDAAFDLHVYGRDGDFSLYLPNGTTAGAIAISPERPPSLPSPRSRSIITTSSRATIRTTKPPFFTSFERSKDEIAPRNDRCHRTAAPRDRLQPDARRRQRE